MSPERWRKIEELLDAALDLSGTDRAAFLADACGADGELRRKVEELLAACEDPAHFPDAPAAVFAAQLLDAAEPGLAAASQERIGVYRIVREVGRGGMGTVYLAERDDGEFEQRVALKLMRVGLSDDPSHMRRFRKERQILARLTHPNIARLLDGGVTADGRPFFVMEYVEGQPIDQYCNDRHLSIDERLGLFLTVCDAVAHAHWHRIVHRDLKPSNILITADGEVKLLDFGIAKPIMAAGDTGDGLTRTGERLLTPEYASPEQIQGLAVNETSDVYALGVLLFELLTGRRPYARTGRTPHEFEGAILREEPTRPSTAVTRSVEGAEAGRSITSEQIGRERRTTPDQLRRRLRGDLDAIVLQALRKEPSRRYGVAEQLASDVRRHLQGLPVRARVDTRVNRLRRFVRRHRLSIGMAMAGALAGVVVLAAALAGLRDRTGIGENDPTAVVFDPAWIVVTPLENRTGEAALDPLGAMAAEWITQALWRTALVKVIDPRTAFDAAHAVGGTDEAHPLRAIAERTGAGTVVSGSYYLDGDELRFQAQITDAATGRLRQSTDAVHAPRDRPTDALEPLRQRITGALAVLLDERLNNWTVSSSQPPLYEAYQEFLLGMAAFGTDYPVAIRHFARAAQLDSTHWQAYLWQGQAYANSRNYPAADSVFTLLLPHRAQLAPYDDANLDYFYHGFVHGDWQPSYDGARRMVELAPAAPHALFALGSTLASLNRCEEAVDALARIDIDRGWGRAWAPRVLRTIPRCLHETGDHGRELLAARRMREADPTVGWTRLAEVRALAALGRTDELMRRVDEAIAFAPTDMTQAWESFSPGDFLHETSRELAAHGNAELAARVRERTVAWYRVRHATEAATLQHRRELAGVLYASGEFEEARTLQLRIAADEPNDVASTGMLALLAIRLGRHAEADSLLDELRADHRPYQFGRPYYWLARAAALQGDRPAAVELMRMAHRRGHTRLYAIHTEPDFALVRDYPPFRDLIRPTPSRAR